VRARWVWIAIALAACSGSKSCATGGGGNASAPRAERACADWATRYCKRLESCAPTSVQIDYGDIDTCIARRTLVCSPMLNARGTGMDAPHLETCAQAYDTASCDDVVVSKPPQACNVGGSLPAGAGCGDDSQCSGPEGYCRIAADQTCGVCATLGPIGAACDSARDCQYGLVCYFTCMAPVALGAACDGMRRQCPETLVCFNYSCTVPAQRGVACEPNGDNCDHDHGLFCDGDKKSCTPYSIADVGTTCDNGTICKGGQCSGVPGAASKCTANAGDGASCDARNGPNCSAPSRCVAGACKLPDPTTCG
jgi:hypothetical protein